MFGMVKALVLQVKINARIGFHHAAQTDLIFAAR